MIFFSSPQVRPRAVLVTPATVSRLLLFAVLPLLPSQGCCCRPAVDFELISYHIIGSACVLYAYCDVQHITGVRGAARNGSADFLGYCLNEALLCTWSWRWGMDECGLSARRVSPAAGVLSDWGLFHSFSAGHRIYEVTFSMYLMLAVFLRVYPL